MFDIQIEQNTYCKHLLNVIIFPIQIQNILESFKLESLSHKELKKSNPQMNKLSASNLQTAIKSRIDSSNKYISSPKITSPSRYNQTIEQTRRTINSIISQVNNKKNCNSSAVQLVKTVNTQVQDMLGNHHFHTRNQKKYNTTMQETPHQFSFFNPETYPNQFSLIKKTKRNPEINLSHHHSLEQQNMQLKIALKQKMQQGKELLQRLNFLTRQNTDLKTQLSMQAYASKDLKTTQHKSMPSLENQYIQSPYTRTGKFCDYENACTDEFPELDSYEQLMRGLNKLKKQNEQLRTNAIQLLRMRN